jgi:hypothetical protein
MLEGIIPILRVQSLPISTGLRFGSEPKTDQPICHGATRMAISG